MHNFEKYLRLAAEVGEQPDIKDMSFPLALDILTAHAECLRGGGDTGTAEMLKGLMAAAGQVLALMSVNEDFFSMVDARFAATTVDSMRGVFAVERAHATPHEFVVSTAVVALLSFSARLAKECPHDDGAKEMGLAALYFAKLLFAVFWRAADDPDYFHRLSGFTNPDFVEALKGMLAKQIKPVMDKHPALRSLLPGLPGGPALH